MISQADHIPNPSVYGQLGPAQGAGGTKGLTATQTALVSIARKVEGPGRATHTSPAQSGIQGPEVRTPLRGQGPARRRRTRKSGDRRGARHVQVGTLNSGEVRAGTQSLDEGRSGSLALGGPTK